MISQIANGARLPPIDRVPGWIEALRLTKEQGDELILEAKLAHCPADIADVLRGLMKTRDDLLATLPVLEAAAADLKAINQAQAQRIAELEEQLARRPAP